MPVSGEWYNELGSRMQITVDGSSITGIYHTSRGDASGNYQLVGGVDIAGDPAKTGQAIAWVVVWTNKQSGSSGSVTAWSGQYQIINGLEEIEAIWLLTSESSENSDWASTRINKDVFRRSAPELESIEKARNKRMPSHPI